MDVQPPAASPTFPPASTPAAPSSPPAAQPTSPKSPSARPKPLTPTPPSPAPPSEALRSPSSRPTSASFAQARAARAVGGSAAGELGSPRQTSQGLVGVPLRAGVEAVESDERPPLLPRPLEGPGVTDGEAAAAAGAEPALGANGGPPEGAEASKAKKEEEEEEAAGPQEWAGNKDSGTGGEPAAVAPMSGKKGLGGLLRGALSGLAGVVAHAASAAGLEGLAEKMVDAAEQRAVAFENSISDAAPEVPARSLSQRLRSGVKRSLSMSRRLGFGDVEDADVVEGLHFTLTERQQQLRSEAADFAAEAADSPAVRAREAAGEFPREAVAAAARLGYGRLLVPRAQGGLGLGVDSACSVMEAVGASDLPLAGLLAAHNAAVYLLATYGTSKMLEKFVRQMGPLTSLGALAISEAPGGSDVVSTTTCVEKDASAQFYTLNGCKAWVAGGAAADIFLVLARSSVEARKGLSLFAIPKNLPGVVVGKPASLAGWRSCPVVPLSFNRVVVRTEYLVGKEGQGMELLEVAYSLLRTWLAAATVSYGEALLQSAVDAAGGGVIGGGGSGGVGGAAAAMLPASGVASMAPGGVVGGGGGSGLELQTYQADVARVKTQLQAARLLTRAAAQQLDCKAPSAPCEACTAKIYAVRAAQRAADTAVRILGWRAIQSDQPCHAMTANLHAVDFVGGPPDSLYGTIFAEIYRMTAA